jgi:phenylpropionate dioxygenase-like ring-hydroxylating dioxygenase large terminal subunit
MITSAFILPGLLYPVLLSKDLGRNPVQVNFDENRLVLYRNSTNHVVVHSDICPHQGASFAAGHVEKDVLVCPYHGFQFCDGKFLGLPPRTFQSKHGGFQIPLYDTVETNGLIYVKSPGYTRHETNINVVPEENDPTFRKIQGCRIIQQNHEVVCHNILDNLHVAYIHKFGNRANPLPSDLKYEAMGNFAGRSTFLYRPKPGTLASFISKEPFPEVKVENEHFLPSTTVTRVTTNNKFVKTVVTKALPQGFGQTKLFWELHRNFMLDRLGVGDYVLQNLMEKTLDEDVAILKNVYPHHRIGPIRTKYDVTIQRYQRSIFDFQQNQFLN